MIKKKLGQANDEKELNFNFAKLHIKFIFYRIKRDYMRSHIIKLLSRKYFSFIESNPPKRPDFIIKLRQYDNMELYFNKENKAGYLQIYLKESDNAIVTFYSDPNHYRMLLIEVITQLLNKGGGFIFHQSSVNVGEKIILFSGSSNAGKTTAARLVSEKYPAISSDNGIIKYEGGEFYLYQSPTFDSLKIKPSQQKYKIQKIYFLNKSNKFFIRPLSNKQEIFKRVNEQILQYIPYSKKQLKNIINFVNKIDFADLYFARNRKKLIQLIDEDLK